MDALIKLFIEFNKSLYRLSGGRLGSRMGGQSVLLLRTVGRKSGKERVTPLSYYRDEDDYLVVASNWGKEMEPAWFLNLLRQPKVSIQVKDRVLQVEAHPAGDGEYPRLWALVSARNPQYSKYQQGLKRRIPIVVLRPLS
ncbi:MAG: nitroreductase family deazaflavin-dependent oxidoreductase [Chloroflexi bacterium]|nr:nitroreductase family deazaflavin-dependent oxidoreductase [Chloroflexota bacterium]